MKVKDNKRRNMIFKNALKGLKCFVMSLLFTTIIIPSDVWAKNHQTGTNIDAWTKLEAELCTSFGPATFTNNGGILNYIAEKPWVQYDSVDFHNGTNYIQLNAANNGNISNIQLLINNVVVDTLPVLSTSSSTLFQSANYKLKKAQSGIKNVKFVFLNDSIAIDWFTFSAEAPKKMRVVISTDFPPLDVCMSGCASDHTSDPDDVQSMVRFLLYSNEFDVEGLIASSGTYANIAKKQNILDIIDLYDQVDENLRRHKTDFPTADALRAVTFQGLSGTWGKTIANNIGTGKDSEASNAIISLVDKVDSRPIWFCFWGDCSNLAQAIWKVQNTRSAEALKAFISKIRVFQIAHQDETIDWLLNNFPDLFIIYSKSTYMGVFGGPSDPLGSLSWVNTNVRQNHGVLGAIYPPAAISVEGLKEGDSPSFMYLISAVHGLNNPEIPSEESWGGRYVRSGSTNHWVDGIGGSSISKWKSEYQAEFAMRADWMVDSANIIQNIQKSNDGVSIIPNPVKNELKIRSEVEFDSLRIFNSEGRLVLEKGVFQKTKSAALLIDLPRGVYLLNIQMPNSSTCKKFVIG